MDNRPEIPLRAQSVNLAQRPATRYERNIRSAGFSRPYPNVTAVQTKSKKKKKSRHTPCEIAVKQVTKKISIKPPCAVSVQTLTIPMKYADNLTKHSTSKPQIISNNHRSNTNRTKYSNPPKQGGDNKRLCETVGCETETENKLLLQISEAQHVRDFERILNSNAIACKRAREHVWRGTRPIARSASALPRAHSAYTLQNITETYYVLFKQHQDTLQSIIDSYRKTQEENNGPSTPDLIVNEWYEDLQGLSEFYEDDQELRSEIASVQDRLVSQHIAESEKIQQLEGKSNFNVNLADLISLRVSGERASPSRDELELSPDVEYAEKNCEEKEWLTPIMSANSNERHKTQDKFDSSVDCLTQNLDSVKIDNNDKVPTITFSNCCDGRSRSDIPNNKEVVIHLTVPSVESIDEARPPMM